MSSERSSSPSGTPPRPPRGYRRLQLDGVLYLWRGALGPDRFHDPLTITVRRAELASRAGRPVLRARGAPLVVETRFGGSDRCLGEQCGPHLPPSPIGPRDAAELVRCALALGWRSEGAEPFRCQLDSQRFVREGSVQLLVYSGSQLR